MSVDLQSPEALQPVAVVRKEQGDETEHLSYIDSLRGWAFLGVLLIHCAYEVPNLSPGILDRSMQGQYGVQLFYVISAYTLFASMDQRKKREPRPTLSYFLRRFFRIAPLFYCAVAFYLLWYGTGPSYHTPNGVKPYHILSMIFFVNGAHPLTINSIVPGGWSVAVEMSFYLLIPLLFARIKSVRQAILLLCGALVLQSFWSHYRINDHLFRSVTHMEPHFMSDYDWMFLVSQLPVFCMGIVYFQLQKQLKAAQAEADPADRLKLAAAPISQVALLGAGLVILFSIKLIVPEHVIVAYGFLLLAWGLSLAPNILNNRVTRYIGTVSFSAYLTHFFVLDAVCSLLNVQRPHPRFSAAFYERIFPHVINGSGIRPTIMLVVLLVVVGALSVGVSTLTYRFIESPGRRLGRKVIAMVQRTGA